jgi:purine-binding chemotaxis protein CheW
VQADPKRDLAAWQSRLIEALRGDLGEEPGESAAEETASGRTEVLAFELAGELYGVDIRELAEILLPRATTPLPRTPAFVDGVLTLRGTVLPVIDLAHRLGLPRSDPTRAARIVVLRDGEEFVGFRVDQVRGVVRFNDREVESSDYATAVDPRFLRGIGYDRQDRLVAVLDARQLCEFTLEEA